MALGIIFASLATLLRVPCDSEAGVCNGKHDVVCVLVVFSSVRLLFVLRLFVLLLLLRLLIIIMITRISIITSRSRQSPGVGVLSLLLRLLEPNLGPIWLHTSVQVGCGGHMQHGKQLQREGRCNVHVQHDVIAQVRAPVCMCTHRSARCPMAAPARP